MITGTFWSKPNRSCKAIFLESISSNSAYIMLLEYPEEGQLYSVMSGKICKAKIVKVISKVKWESCKPPFAGYYIHNST